jgi:[ribosomal protein S5]-alanine N-acetyltransferase
MAGNAMIKTKRLTLRPLQQEDAAPLERELNNFNITRNTGRVPYPYSNQDAVEYLQFVSQQPAQSCIRAITLKDQLIGVIGYLYSIEKQDAELGYWLSEQHWGKGFMTEAADAMVHRAFTVSNTPKLIACFQNENPVSGRILAKLGFVEIGGCNSFSKARGEDVPVTNTELMREGWLATQKSRGE